MNYQLRLLGLSPEENQSSRAPPYERVNGNHRLGSAAHSHPGHLFVKDPLRIYGLRTSSLIDEATAGKREFLSSVNGGAPAGFPPPSHCIASVGSPPSHSVERISGDERSILLGLLRACAKNKDLHRGIQVHEEISRKDLIEECSDALVIMYAKCGALEKAKALLSMYRSVNVFPWTALIVEYAREGRSQDALLCFEEMQHEGINSDAVTYASVLKACGNIRALDKGRQIHCQILHQDLLQNDAVLSSALVDMYAKCGDLSKAHYLLEELPSRDVICWSSLMMGYAQNGQGEQALHCFDCMQHEGITPDAATYTCALKACGALGAVGRGVQIHDEIARRGLLRTHAALGNALVDMYAKCGALMKAQSVLEELPCQDVVSWNALITGFAQHGQGEQALNRFRFMQHDGILPDVVTYLCVLKACGTIGAVVTGTLIHGEIAKKGLLQSHTVLGNALVDMYAKCGALSEARRVLMGLISRDVVCWNALITGCAQQGQGEQALECFELMQTEGILPNVVTYVCILKACGSIGAVDKGKQIHERVARDGLLQNHIILGNALVDMYVKCDAVSVAYCVLQELPSRDVISWNVLISGYIQAGLGEEALICFERMHHEGIPPDVLTFTCILKACGITGALNKGKEIENEIVRRGLLQNDLVLGNALVDMYAKCGALSKAHCVLEELPSRDIISWNALMAGYAQEGLGEQALDCLECMQCEGITPDVATLGCVINVCSHFGLLEKGHEYFVNMTTNLGVKPNLECFTCMMDLCGRAGHLEKAVELIDGLPYSDYSVLWHSLLGACQKWGDIDVGKWAFQQAVQLDEADAPAYVLMANIYGAAGFQEEAEEVEVKLLLNGARV